MATTTEIRTAIAALYSDPGLSKLGHMQPGLAEALLYLIASGGQLQTGVSPGFEGFGRFPRTEAECQFSLPTNSRLVSFICCQSSGVDLFVQMHSSSTALTVGAIPVQAFSIQVPDGGTSGLTLADHGSGGRSFGPDPIIAISTTRDIFTAPASSVLVINGRATVSLTGQTVV